MFAFMLQTIIEIAVATFIIWGLFNEQVLVRFEDRVFAWIKKRIKASRKKSNNYHHQPRKTGDRNCA